VLTRISDARINGCLIGGEFPKLPIALCFGALHRCDPFSKILANDIDPIATRRGVDGSMHRRLDEDKHALMLAPHGLQA
jgi:hypothetical protein